MKRILLSAALLAFGAVSANATPITFEFGGKCKYHCGALDLSRGDSVGGYIQVVDGGLDDGRVDGSELSAFEFSFGNFGFTNLTRWASGSMRVTDGGSSLGGWLGGFTFTGPGRDAITGVLFGIDLWAVTGRWTTTFGYGGYTRVDRDPVDVPEPGTLGLLGLGLIAAGIARRRRQTA